MARVKIEFSEPFIFSTELSVRISDINYGGHVGNDSVLTIAHEARVRFLQHLGCKHEGDVFGGSLIMVDAMIAYKGEGFQGDVLRIDIAIADVSKTHFDLLYKIHNVTRSYDLAHVKTALVFFDYERRKISEAPAAFQEKIKQLIHP